VPQQDFSKTVLEANRKDNRDYKGIQFIKRNHVKRSKSATY